MNKQELNAFVKGLQLGIKLASELDTDPTSINEAIKEEAKEEEKVEEVETPKRAYHKKFAKTHYAGKLTKAERSRRMKAVMKKVWADKKAKKNLEVIAPAPENGFKTFPTNQYDSEFKSV